MRLGFTVLSLFVMLPFLVCAELTDELRAQGKALLGKYISEDDSAKRMDLLEELLELDPAIGGVMWKRISAEWKNAWPDYQKQYSTASQALAKQKDSAASRLQAKRLAARILSLSKKGEPTKEDIEKIGDPALKELRALRRVRVEDVLANSPQLKKSRRRVHQLAEEYNTCIEELVLVDETPIEVAVVVSRFEKSEAAHALPSARELRRMTKQNAKHADDVPAEAIEGIRDLNELRSLLGLQILSLDPRLCKASLGHSKDMVEHGFFAHDSPVAGKETPFKRADMEGTKASSENIAHGVKTPQAANSMWWHSPSHHGNMLNPSHKRVGLGHHAGYWTQLFGR